MDNPGQLETSAKPVQVGANGFPIVRADMTPGTVILEDMYFYGRKPHGHTTKSRNKAMINAISTSLEALQALIITYQTDDAKYVADKDAKTIGMFEETAARAEKLNMSDGIVISHDIPEDSAGLILPNIGTPDILDFKRRITNHDPSLHFFVQCFKANIIALNEEKKAFYTKLLRSAEKESLEKELEIMDIYYNRTFDYIIEQSKSTYPALTNNNMLQVDIIKEIIRQMEDDKNKDVSTNEIKTRATSFISTRNGTVNVDAPPKRAAAFGADTSRNRREYLDQTTAKEKEGLVEFNEFMIQYNKENSGSELKNKIAKFNLLITRAQEQSELIAAKTVEEIIQMFVEMLNILDSIEGRDEVKAHTFSVIANFGVSKLNEKEPAFENIALFGNAGTGKTRVAEMICSVYAKAGILLYPDVIQYTGKDLTGSFIGESGKIMAKKLLDGLEKVVFIDEAYTLVSCIKGRGKTKQIDYAASVYGLESMGELIKFMDFYRGKQIIIVAGYEGDMKNCFFRANEGMKRRFATQITLTDYAPDTLFKILLKYLESNNNGLKDSDLTGMIRSSFERFAQAASGGVFDNQAGDMLNLSVLVKKGIQQHKFSSKSTDTGYTGIDAKKFKQIFDEALEKFIAIKTDEQHFYKNAVEDLAGEPHGGGSKSMRYQHTKNQRKRGGTRKSHSNRS